MNAKKLRRSSLAGRYHMYRTALAVTSLLVFIEAIGAPRKFQ